MCVFGVLHKCTPACFSDLKLKMVPPVSGWNCPTLERQVPLIKKVVKGSQQKSDITKEFSIPPFTNYHEQGSCAGWLHEKLISKGKSSSNWVYPEVESVFLQWLRNRSANLPVHGPAFAMTSQSSSWRPNFLRSFWGCTQNRWWRSERQLWLETLFCEILQGGVRVYERENLRPPVRST